MKYLLLLLLTSSAFSAEHLPVKATFLQYQSWVSKLKDSDWEAELQAMQEAGIKTVVLQWLKYDQERFFPIHAEKTDPTERILAFADAHGMQVYVGLWFLTDWWKRWNDAEFLKSTAGRVAEFARLEWDRYRQHPSWVGWYLPFELGDTDFEDTEIVALNGFLASLSGSCRKISNRPMQVASSVFFSQKLPAPAVEQVFRKMFSGAGLDVVIIQDGLGEQNWDEAMRKKSELYIAGLTRAAKSAGAKAWIAVEVFKTEHDANGKPGKRVPGQISEILPRVDRERKMADELLFFDFFHYMSPFRGPEQKSLFSAYK